MLKKTLLLLSVCSACVANGQSTWVQVKVDIPDVATLERLQDSDLEVLDCVLHLGSADVAVEPGGYARLIQGGFTYWFVRPLEDPHGWDRTHVSNVRPMSDDYRLHYFTADQILSFFEALRTQYPTYVTRKAIGLTINNETMWAYRIGRPVQQSHRAVNNIVVEGMIHAREWIAGSVMMHIAKKTVDGLTTPQTTVFLPNQAVWVVPMANPDGYRYSWSSYRLWRKNRRNNGGGSYGVDLNRNYSTGWGMNGGSSSNPSSETYRGTAPFSEPETVAVRDFIAGLPRVGGFLDYHSFAQLVMWPWGYTTTAPPDAAMFNTIGDAMKTAMSAFGATYDQGQTSRILYIASGVSNDYFYDVYGIPGMSAELRDTGQYGFELPETEIYATQDEVWAGFRKYLSYIPS